MKHEKRTEYKSRFSDETETCVVKSILYHCRTKNKQLKSVVLCVIFDCAHTNIYFPAAAAAVPYARPRDVVISSTKALESIALVEKKNYENTRTQYRSNGISRYTRVLKKNHRTLTHADRGSV